MGESGVEMRGSLDLQVQKIWELVQQTLMEVAAWSEIVGI